MEPNTQTPPVSQAPVFTPSAPVVESQQANTPPPQTPISIPPTGQEKKVGPIVATLIIVLVLIIAALYLFASRINQSDLPSDSTLSAPYSDTAGQTTLDETTPSVQSVTNQSTDLEALQNDLNMSTSGLDSQNF